MTRAAGLGLRLEPEAGPAGREPAAAAVARWLASRGSIPLAQRGLWLSGALLLLQGRAVARGEAARASVLAAQVFFSFSGEGLGFLGVWGLGFRVWLLGFWASVLAGQVRSLSVSNSL